MDELIDTAEAKARFGAARVARLATVSPDAGAHIVPCCFAILDTGGIVSAVDGKPKSTTALQRLANIEQHPRVSLVVDHYDDDDWTQLWWVRVDGTASTVETGPKHSQAIDALVAKYPQYQADRPLGAAIIIEPTTWRHWQAQ